MNLAIGSLMIVVVMIMVNLAPSEALTTKTQLALLMLTIIAAGIIARGDR